MRAVWSRAVATLVAGAIATLIAVIAVVPSVAGAARVDMRGAAFGRVAAGPYGNQTGIYRDPAGGFGACISPDARQASGRYRQAGRVFGAAGTWAWEFWVARATPAGATWPDRGIRAGGPLRYRRDHGVDAGASIDQAANLVDPHENYERASRLYHVGAIGPALAAFARAYPGPWRLRVKFPHHARYLAGRRYAGTATLLAKNGRTVPVSGLPGSIRSTRDARVRLLARRTVSGVLRFEVTPGRSGRFEVGIAVHDTAPASARLMIPAGGTGSGYQFLLQLGSIGAADAKIGGRAAHLHLTTRITPTAASSGPQVVERGQAIRDAITVAGDDGEAGTITARLEAVPAPADGLCTQASLTSASVLATRRLTLRPREDAGNGAYTTAPVTLAAGGQCATWVDTLTLRPSRVTLTTAAGIAAETVLVIAPAIRTDASTQLALAGRAIDDTVTISGDAAQPAVVTGALLGPARPVGDRCSSVNWGGARVARRFAPLSVDGDGVYRFGLYRIPRGAAGCYTYTERLVPQTNVAAVTPVSSPAGQAMETVLAIHPSVQTVSGTLTPDDRLVDTVTVAGTDGVQARVRTRLLLAAAVNGSCRRVDWARARAVGRESFPIDAAGRYTTMPLGPIWLVHGRTTCTTFTDTLRVGGHLAAWVGPGKPTETRRITPQTRVFEVDTWHMTTDACARKVLESLSLPSFRYGALEWTYTTAYGHSCFAERWQEVTVRRPARAAGTLWLKAINDAISAPGVGHVHLLRPLRGLRAGTITIAWTVGPHAWLKGRPSVDRAPQLYFARS